MYHFSLIVSDDQEHSKIILHLTDAGGVKVQNGDCSQQITLDVEMS